mgnify:FL=1
MAYLRVYEPLENFPENQRAFWQEHFADSTKRNSEQIDALHRLITQKVDTSPVNGAYVIKVDSKSYVAPWSTSQRCLTSFNDFKSSVPSSVLPMFFPQGIDPDSIFLGDTDFQGPTYVKSETWMIPPRWFSLFVPEERMRGHTESGAFTIMRTDISKAKERCISTHRAVRNAFGTGPVEAELVELLNWLNIFDPRSIVECDYGGLAMFLEKSLKNEGEPGLESDTSIEDVQESIQGLSNGDGVQAGRGYERLVTRWRRVAAFEQAI